MTQEASSEAQAEAVERVWPSNVAGGEARGRGGWHCPGVPVWPACTREMCGQVRAVWRPLWGRLSVQEGWLLVRSVWKTPQRVPTSSGRCLDLLHSSHAFI